MNDLPPITHHYLLCIQIKCYCDTDGHKYLERLWFKDLKQHLKYLKNLTIACPFQYGKPPADVVPLDSDDSFSRIRFIPLPSPKNFLEALLFFPITITKFWQGIGEADIVHSFVGGWPISWDWFITPIVKLRRKFYIIIVESAPWRLQPGMPSNTKARIRAYIYEKIANWSINQTDLAIFNQEKYRQNLLTNSERQGYIIHASWIDADNIISEAETTRLWRQKVSASTPALTVLFAGRLIPSKGVFSLLEAMKILDREKIPVMLDILGEGELLEECKKVSQVLQNVQLKTLGTVPYGEQFFKLLQTYHAVVVPSISDEQPRIVYDAYSQAVPIIASNTPGLRDCVQHEQTGMLAQSNDPLALANLLKWSWQNLDKLEKMGRESLKLAQQTTHQEMHRQRWKILCELIKTDQKLANLTNK
jgi:glycosyltransferase involved in cell wall biosynthesis